MKGRLFGMERCGQGFVHDVHLGQAHVAQPVMMIGSGLLERTCTIAG